MPETLPETESVTPPESSPVDSLDSPGFVRVDRDDVERFVRVPTDPNEQAAAASDATSSGSGNLSGDEKAASGDEKAASGDETAPEGRAAPTLEVDAAPDHAHPSAPVAAAAAVAASPPSNPAPASPRKFVGAASRRGSLATSGGGAPPKRRSVADASRAHLLRHYKGVKSSVANSTTQKQSMAFIVAASLAQLLASITYAGEAHTVYSDPEEGRVRTPRAVRTLWRRAACWSSASSSSA